MRDPLAAMGLNYHLTTLLQFRVCAEVNEGALILPYCTRLQPDVVVYDPCMKHCLGLDLIPALLECRPGLRVVTLTADESQHSVQRALQAGATACVMRCDPPEAVMSAISGRHEGHCYVSPQAASLLADEVARGSLVRPENVLAVLSAQELAVYTFLSTQLSIKEIAIKMKSSLKSIETYQRRIKQKLGLVNSKEVRSSAARFLKLQKAMPSAHEI